jgi:hypothetical protein
MKFKSDIEVQAGLKDSSGANGSAGQVLSSNGSTVSWVNETTVASDVQNEVKAGVAINKGQAVYVTGADGTNIIVGLASNTTEATSSKTLGLLNATVAINGFADVVQIGRLAGLNTSAATVGDPVWLGTNGNLIYGLANKPYAPAHLVFIGVVTRVNSNNGEIFINVQNGFELNEIHDVDIKTNVPINGDVLGYDGTLWVNKTIAEWLGYTPADDALVVHKAGTETITGSKTFTSPVIINKATANTDAILLNVGGNQQGRLTINNDGGFDLFTSTDFSGYGINFDANDSNGLLFYADNPNMAKFIVGDNYNISQQDLYSTKFIKLGGTADQYLKADGSVSTAMNSRVEVNFITTAGQTTFVTPYEVGQVEVYYNGSKLYPDEFVATNGTTIVLVTPATLNAQISIVKFVSSFNTTSIRTETVFTTTGGQTTFSVNYAIGQVDVFYNGSKLSPAEFTAVNGTSVVLGFACAAGESIVINSYVNQVSGASGTANYMTKFTGAASLGNSTLIDNGTSVSLTNADSRLYGGTNAGRFIIGNPSVNTYLAVYGSTHATLPNFAQFIVNNIPSLNMLASGAIGIGTSSPGTTSSSNILLGFVNGSNIQARNEVAQIAMSSNINGDWYAPTYKNSGYASQIYADANGGTIGLRIAPSGTAGASISWNQPAVYVTSANNVIIGGSTDAGYKLDVNGTGRFTGNLFLPSLTTGYLTKVGTSGLITFSKLYENSFGGIQINNTDTNGAQYYSLRVGPRGNNDGISSTWHIPSNASPTVGWATSASSTFYSIATLADDVTRLHITSGGNVGIGTIIPDARLHLRGASSFNRLTQMSPTGASTDAVNLIASTNPSGSDQWWSWGVSNDDSYRIVKGTDLSGTGVKVTVGSTSWTSSSDIRIKNVIGKVENALEKIDTLSPIFYELKDDKLKTKRVGLIAQEVYEVLPESVDKPIKEEDVWGVRYTELIPLLVASIQEQQAQIKELQDELVLLKNK